MIRLEGRDLVLVAAASIMAVPTAGQAAEPEVAGPLVQIATTPISEPDLSRLSLEELAMVEVTSVSRRPESLANAA